MSQKKIDDLESLVIIDLDEEDFEDIEIEEKIEKTTNKKTTPRSQKVASKKEASKAEKVASKKEAPKAEKVTSKKASHKEERKPRGKIFKLSILVYVLLLSTGIVFVWGFLWKNLEVYQNDIDAKNAEETNLISESRAPQLAFLDEISTMTDEQWIALWNEANPEDYNGTQKLADYFGAHFAKENLSYYKASSYTKDNPVYLVKDEALTLAEIQMQGQGDDWNIAQVDFLVEGKMSDSIVVPTDYLVYCNGILAGDNCKQQAEGIKVEDYEEELTNPVEYSTYTFDGLFEEPEITIEAPDNYKKAEDVYGNYYLAMDSSEVADYQQKADEFIKALLHYYSYGKNSLSANMVAVSSHVASGSQAQKIIKQAQDGLQWVNYDGANYVTETSEVYRLADNCYCVDVSYEDMKENSTMKPGIYRVFFLDLGSGYKIYNFTLYK